MLDFLNNPFFIYAIILGAACYGIHMANPNIWPWVARFAFSSGSIGDRIYFANHKESKQATLKKKKKKVKKKKSKRTNGTKL